MVPQQSEHFPGPSQAAFTAAPPVFTPPPTTSSDPARQRLKRRRIREPQNRDYIAGSSSWSKRQVVTDLDQVEQAKRQCEVLSGNDVISCFPTNDTIVPQHEWASLVWNSRRPQLTQLNEVDIYLFRADSLQQVLHYRNVTNNSEQAGVIRAQVNDTWFGSDGTKWSGRNVSYPFYWVVSRSDKPLDGSQQPQAVFSAVQTTFADSVIASMASSSAAAASVSAASLSSLSVLSATRSSSAGPTQTAGASVQSSSGESSFPRWAIAVIVILGFLAIAATCILTFLIIRRIRRRNSEYGSNRNSMGSSSPMIEHPGGNPQSPLLASGAVRQTPSIGHAVPRPPSVVSPDGVSDISRTNSAGDQGPFSGADAAIMADAFRQALRKPDFANAPVEEGDSPKDNPIKEELLNRELAEEGRDIRSVSSSRGVRVETLSDHGDTIRDSPH